MFEHLDEPARRVVEAAVGVARERGESAVGTQHLLFALATADAVTGRLLTEAASGAELNGVGYISPAWAAAGRGGSREPVGGPRRSNASIATPMAPRRIAQVSLPRVIPSHGMPGRAQVGAMRVAISASAG
jgi:hypothetical protein